MTRILGDVEAIGEVFTAGVVAILGDVITLGGVVAVMLVLHFRLTLIIFAVLPLLVGAAMALRRPVRRAYRDVRARLAHLNAELQETISGMAVIQLFGREAARGGELRELSDRYRQAQFRRVGLESSALRRRRGGRRDRRGRAPLVGRARDPRRHADLRGPGGLHAVHAALLPPIRDASAKFSVMQAATVAAERVFALLDTPAEIGGTAPARRRAHRRRRRRRPGPRHVRDVARVEAPAAGPGVPGRLVRLSRGRRRASSASAAAARTRTPAWALRGVSLRIETGERSRWSAAPGRGRRRSPGSSRGPTTSSAARCWSKASTSGSGT